MICCPNKLQKIIPLLHYVHYNTLFIKNTVDVFPGGIHYVGVCEPVCADLSRLTYSKEAKGRQKPDSQQLTAISRTISPPSKV